MAYASLHSNPFPGIRSYEPDEDELFFGREHRIKELIEKLSETRFLAIVGSSGCGKSSLIKAGLIPALLKHKVRQSQDNWKLILTHPGSDPIRNLAESILECFGHQVDPAQTEIIISKLLASASSLPAVIREIAGNDALSYLLVIDQFEELFRFRQNSPSENSGSEAAHFVELVLHATRQAEVPVSVALSMRTDFIDDCTAYPRLNVAINRGYYLVPRMEDDEKRLAITGPLGVRGIRITDELVDRLLKDVGDDPDQLPIMQHALMRTFDYWSVRKIGDEPIGLAHYEAIGTMKEALSVHCEEIYAELGQANLQLIAEKIFKALTDFTTDSRGTRRTVKLSALCVLSEARQEEVIKVIDLFRESGRAFLRPSYHIDLQDNTTIDISHESIMRVWTRLRKWVDEERSSAQLYLRLSNSAELYQLGRTGLWINPELQLALQWREANKPNATWAVRYDAAFDRAMEFLNYSQQQFLLEIGRKEDHQKRTLKQARRFAMILGAATLISILFLVVSLNLSFKADASRKDALEKQKLAVTESKKAEEQRQEAIIQKRISEQQQQIAEQQKYITEEQRQYAVNQQGIAEIKTKEAIQQKIKADVSRKEAIHARDETEIQRKEAVNQKQIADQERNKASVSEQNAQRLRMIAIGKAMAIQSAKMQTSAEGDLPSLLALQAFQFLQSNHGNLNDPDVFNALSAVADEKLVFRGHTDEIRAVLINKSGNRLYSCSTDGAIMQWNPEKPEDPPGKFNLPKRIKYEFRALALSKDEKWLAAGTASGEILLYNTSKTNELPVVINTQSGSISQLGFCKKNNLVSSGNNGLLKIWDLGSAVPVEKNSIRQTKKISAIAYHEGKDLLYFGTVTGQLFSLKMHGEESGPELITKVQKSISALTLSPDNQYIAIGMGSGLIKVIHSGHPETGQIDLIGHVSPITALVFSSNGKSLASSSYDRTIRLWNYLETTSPPVLLTDNDKWVYGITFTPDQQKIISCGADKTLRVFQINPEVLSGRICGFVKRNLTESEWNKYIGNDIPYHKTCDKK